MALSETIHGYLNQHFVITSAQAQALGINRTMLKYYVDKGDLVRIGRGVYTVDQSFLFDSLKAYIPYLARWPEAVISGVSALQYYGLTDEDYQIKWLTIPQEQRVRSSKDLKIIYAQNSHYSLGIKKIKMKKFTIQIYEAEKALIDVFKYGDSEMAIKCLKEYLRWDKKNLKKLALYGKKLRHSLDEKIKILLIE